ncbi:MAG: GTP cyclohydrolase I FolE [Deltaproteobacteria bacterium]|nr:GTP cyclohydrolase I FolE [Deltaproteobacteria bacterium]
MQQHIAAMLRALGEDPAREGLQRTPERMERSLRFLTDGYRQDPMQLLRDAVFTERYREMVVVRDIPFYSLCEHHLLPFFGKAHVAYLPKGKLVGLSKIPRMVDLFARRLQVQERMTQQIAETLHEILQPYGVGVVLEAQHLCMQMRGVEKEGTTMTTSTMLGTFESVHRTREEFLSLIRAR